MAPFRMPGEFEPHAACWMLWPARPDVWREQAAPARSTFAAVAAAIARFEPVRIGVLPHLMAAARASVPEAVTLVEMAYNDAWMRDVGPTFVVDDAGGRRGIDWRFNAWGGLYEDYRADDGVAAAVLDWCGVPRERAPLVMEGGALAADGEGTLIVTEQCLLNPNRNPDLDRKQIESHLKRLLGAEVVIWLGEGVHGDETDGHVDNLCTFVRPGSVALTWSDDPADPQHAISRDALERLHRARDARGRRLEVHKIHQPGPMVVRPEEAAGLVRVAGTLERPAGSRLAASYVNYYLANRAVIVPVFDDRRDGAALATIARLHPEREVVPIESREILLGGGNIHCITQQEPLAGPGP